MPHVEHCVLCWRSKTWLLIRTRLTNDRVPPHVVPKVLPPFIAVFCANIISSSSRWPDDWILPTAKGTFRLQFLSRHAMNDTSTRSTRTLISVLRSVPLSLWVGAALALVGFAVVFTMLSGDISDPYLERAIRARVTPTCNVPEGQRLDIQGDFHVQHDNTMSLKIALFDSVSNRADRTRLLAACESVRYDLGFEPTVIGVDPHLRHVPTVELDCRPDHKYCFRISGDALRMSRGSIRVLTERPPRRQTFSSRVLELGLSTNAHDTDLSAEVLLPQEAVPISVVPPPVHMISGAATKLHYRGSDTYGTSKPLSGRQRAIVQTLGIKVVYQNPVTARVEEVLLVVASALFGIGVALVIEGWFKLRDLRAIAGTRLTDKPN